MSRRSCSAPPKNAHIRAKAAAAAPISRVQSKAALLGASLNVFINTKAMTDRHYAEDLNKKAIDMIANYTVMADEIFNGVFSRLTK